MQTMINSFKHAKYKEKKYLHSYNEITKWKLNHDCILGCIKFWSFFQNDLAQWCSCTLAWKNMTCKFLGFSGHPKTLPQVIPPSATPKIYYFVMRWWIFKINMWYLVINYSEFSQECCCVYYQAKFRLLLLSNLKSPGFSVYFMIFNHFYNFF